MSELRTMQEAAGAEWMAFGDAQIAATFGQYEAEYAAIRRRVGIMHLPQRGLLRLTGADVKDFLHRLLTQEINAMAGGQSRRAFMLNVKGRIIADMIVHHGDVDTWLDTDAADIDALAAALDGRLFTDDVKIENVTDEWVAFALHGPSSGALLDALGRTAVNEPGTHHVMQLADENVSVYRLDTCGVEGHVIWCKQDHAPVLYSAMFEAAGFDPGAPDPTEDPQGAADAARLRRESLRGRPIGWQAFNTARIEAGAVMFHVDFGGDCLPHETGILHDVTSFTKGCYVGQEIVARMENLGHPKRILTGFQLGGEHLPIAGAQVLAADDPNNIIGAVTSSTIAPMRGNDAIGFAMMKWASHAPGTRVAIAADGDMAAATITALSCSASSDQMPV